MDASSLRALIEDVAAGRCTPDDAVRQLRRLPYSDLGFARVDHHRDLRLGIPEAVYGPGKTPEHCAAVVEELLSETDGPVLLTRATEAQVKAVTAAAPPLRRRPGRRRRRAGRSRRWSSARHPRGREPSSSSPPERPTFRWPPNAWRCSAHSVSPPPQLTDCGVAGLHRLLAELDTLAMADAVVVIAGMEGALASVVGGLTPAPVVAVPTSTGYGAALEGVTALLAMLSACSSGHHGRRHRQRLRRRLRDRPAPPVTTAGFGLLDGGVVPLLRRHRGRHGPGITRRRRRRRRRGPRAAQPARRSPAGTSSSRTASAGGIACTRAVVGGDDVVVRTHGVIAALIEEAALPAAGDGAGASRLPQAGLGGIRPAPSAHRPGALPRGRRARRHHRHRRDGRRARGARRRRGVRLRGGNGNGHGAQRARPAAESGAGDGPPARGDPVVRTRRRRSSSRRRPAPRCSPRSSTAFGPLPDMTVTASGFGGGAGEMDDLPNCTQVVIGRRVGRPDVGSRTAARCCSRPTSTT